VNRAELIARYIEPDPWHPGPADVQVRGYGVPVWALVGHLPAVDHNPEQLARAYDLPLEAVEAALAYYEANRALIDGRLAANAAEPACAE
jgi:uncharacterized protein (DUF433 family)